MTATALCINADRTQQVVVHGMKLPWIDSPVIGVQRKMLERIGNEIAVATSIVRYAAGSTFDSHVHELGEEFLVLEGTFADERGSYPAGTYVRNPPGSSHAPFSDKGCTILVKLRQMTRKDTDAVTLLPNAQQWTRIDAGVHRALLYTNDSSQVELVRMEAGSELMRRFSLHGEELFIIHGSVLWADTVPVTLTQWSWVRSPGDDHCALFCRDDTLLWIKRGHLLHTENKG